MNMNLSMNKKKVFPEKPPLEEEEDYWETHVRLPRTTQPVLYDIMFKPKFSLGRFYGEETITIDLLESTSYIVLHAKSLLVKSTSVTDLNNTNIPVKKSFSYEPHEFWVITLMSAIPPGRYNIGFDFEGVFKNRTAGVYRGSNNTEQHGSPTRYFLASKFLPMDARQAFPCFDEPSLKAKFTIKLVRPMNGYVAITNELMEKEEFGPDLNEVTVHFKETPPIATYQVLLLVSDIKDAGVFEIKQENSILPLRMYAAPALLQETDFPKAIASQLITFYSGYFGMPCPSSKLDLVVIKDYPMESHEFWGAVTYNNTSMVSDKAELMMDELRKIAMDLSQSLSLIWFGNLAKLTWWDKIWLRNSFAKYMQYKALEEGVMECSNWAMMEQLFRDCIYSVLDDDANINSKPLCVSVDSLEEVQEFCCGIPPKGVAILKMLENFVGRENFRRGVNRYLTQFRPTDGSTADGSDAGGSETDFWQCVKAESPDLKMDLLEVMDTWTKQAGYPIIYATRRINTWILTQSRYMAEQDSFFNLNDSPFRYKWDVPIYYITSNSKTPEMVWFDKGSQCLKLSISDRTITFLKLNHNQMGFFRVNYEGCIWAQFAQLLLNDHTVLSSVDRANLLDDVFSLAESGYTDYQSALNMLRYLEAEGDFLPWFIVHRNMKKIFHFLSFTSHFDSAMKFVRLLVDKLYDHISGHFNWNCNPTSPPKKLLTEVILELSCMSEVPFCISDLAAKFKEWIKSEKASICPDLRKLMLIYGMREIACFDDWKLVYSRYEKETNGRMKNELLECLANSRDSWALMRLFEDFQSSSRTEEIWVLLETISDNWRSHHFEWEIMKNEWETLERCLLIPNRRFDDFFLHMTQKFSTNSKFEEVKEFIQNHPMAFTHAATAKQAVDSISRNLKWVKKNQLIFSSWLSANTKD